MTKSKTALFVAVGSFLALLLLAEELFLILSAVIFFLSIWMKQLCSF